MSMYWNRLGCSFFILIPGTWVTGYNFQNIVFQSLKIDFVLENSADPNEMQHYVVFDLGLHCKKYVTKIL